MRSSRSLNDLAVADDKVTMFEYCLTRLVWSYLLDVADPSRRSKVGNGSLNAVRPVVTTLLGDSRGRRRLQTRNRLRGRWTVRCNVFTAMRPGRRTRAG